MCEPKEYKTHVLSDSYQLKEYNFENGFLNDSVDATYIIHYIHNDRLPNIMKQLSTYQPTKTTYILLNEGYKTGKKQDFIDNTAKDLIDAFLTVMKHADENNYNTVLILEDDFIFHSKILDKKHTDSINTFLLDKKKKDEIFLYFLGAIPYLQERTESKHNYLYSSLGTHSVIYSKKVIKKCLQNGITKIKDWDLMCYTIPELINKRYIYYKPLCYQLFPETENQKKWGIDENDNKFIVFWKDIYFTTVKQRFKNLNLDKNVEPGYSIFYKKSCIRLPIHRLIENEKNYDLIILLLEALL